VAEARRQFGNPKEGECPPLEGVTRELVKTKLNENIECMCPRVRWGGTTDNDKFLYISLSGLEVTFVVGPNGSIWKSP
jgi:hypothetical protein